MTSRDAIGATALVSVVMPAFNDARYIRKAIESALEQSHDAVEVVVVDDGSSDGSAAIARGYGPRVRVFEQCNSGAAVARNRGLDEARGEYIAFLDADDFWHPRKIELQLRHLGACSDCVAVYCNKVEVRGNSDACFPPIPDATADWVSTDPTISGWLYLPLLRDSLIHTSTILIARKTIERVGRFDATLRKGQDLDYWLRLSRFGPIHRMDAVLSAYRIHADSISHKALPMNYHALVVERAVAKFGLEDPSGQTLERADLDRILGDSWFQFAYSHYRLGTLAVSVAGVRRALAYQPARLRTWSLALRAYWKRATTGRSKPSN